MTAADRDHGSISRRTRERLLRELLLRGAAPRDAWSHQHLLEWVLTLTLLLFVLYLFAQL